MKQIRFKQFLRERNQFSLSGDETLLSVSEYYGVKPRAEAFEGEEFESRASTLEGYRIVKKNDLVMNYMLAWKGAYGISKHDGIASPAYSVFQIDRNIVDVRYLHHRVRSDEMKAYFRSRSKGIIESRLRLYPDSLLASFVSIPDLSTQREIADFLDRETARIDLLIEKKQKLVALLGEKAKSVNELFFINAGHTDAQPLHRLYRVVTGKTPSRNDEDNFSIEEGLPWATPANLGFLAPVETTKECLSSKGLEGQPVVDAGTVLLNGIGASVGKIGIAGTKLSFNQQIHALIAKKRVLADRFLFFQLLTLKEQLVLLANSTTLPILNAERLGRLELKIFDLDEQRRHCANMDALLQHEAGTAVKIITSIDRLKEYRSALITAAVTGQIDVTTYAKSDATDRRLDAIQEEMGA